MKHFFEYNWQVRNDWFELLTTISEEELHKKRVGGVGSIAFNKKEQQRQCRFFKRKTEPCLEILPKTIF